MLSRRYALVVFILATLFSSAWCIQQVFAHGSMEIPVSRVYNCRQEGPETPRSAACKAAVAAGGTQAIYDWNGVNRLEANGRHREIIPDGKLCSAGKESHKGLDLARSDWPARSLAPNQGGAFDFVFLATAPHASRYFEFYITKNGYNPTQPLRWSDLEAAPFCSVTNVTLQNGRYRLPCTLPSGKTGRHVIYNIWQRSDSTEAFYTCVDVVFGNDITPPPPPPPPPTPWRELGQLRAQQGLPVGTTVRFRLFDGTGRDVESRSITLQAGLTAASAWPFILAQAVNAQSQLVRIGILGSNGTITPVRSSQRNIVYVQSNAQFSFAVDIDIPSGGTPPDGGSVQFNYPNGRGSYVAGTKVRGTEGRVYQCKPFPASGWCNGWDLYYAPGTGLAWQDAWVHLAP